MTRKEAIRWLEDIHRRFNPTGEDLENEGGDVHLQALDMAIESLSSEADRPIGWIPVSERLPKVGEDVLFSIDTMYVSEGCLRDDGDWWQFRWNSVQPKKYVIAWMPLPEPYREDGGDD